MNRSLVVVLAVLCLSMSAFTARADSEVTAGGRVYLQWYSDFSDSLDVSRSDVDFDSYNAFSIQRAYVIVKARLSDKTSGQITYDVRPAGPDIRLKHAFMKWKLLTQPNFDLAAVLGLQATPWNREVERLWGRRYLEKVPLDQLGLLTTADLGISAVSNLGEDGKWGKAQLCIFNGTSYTDPYENNPSKDVNLAVFVTPLVNHPDLKDSELGFQYYSGTLNEYNDSSQVSDDYARSILSFTANMQYREIFQLGFEYDSYKSPFIPDFAYSLDFGDVLPGGFWADTSDNQVVSTAIYGTFWLASVFEDKPALATTNLFFRYLLVDPDTDNHVRGGVENEVSMNEIIVGVECEPVKGFAASLNYRTEKIKDLPDPISDIDNSYLYLNVLLNF